MTDVAVVYLSIINHSLESLASTMSVRMLPNILDILDDFAKLSPREYRRKVFTSKGRWFSFPFSRNRDSNESGDERRCNFFSPAMWVTGVTRYIPLLAPILEQSRRI